ncbi:MAG: 50S ribosomal protein L3 [Nanoarchaeota archaeon]|nr:50S ribosomal protein L3 [Nanoarchaeota archaeon]
MPTRKSPRKGSLQFWPRKRADKFLPSVNWDAIDSEKVLKGFICYKAGMVSAAVKDLTPHSMTKDKKITLPVTILECPPIKILSVRFYKNGKVGTEVMGENLEKELKKKLKLPKKTKKIDEIKKEDFDDLRVIVYSIVKKTGIKKSPDITELGLNGNYEEKINFVKENLGKEISALNHFQKGDLIDLRGLTKGKGLQGPTKRFGLTLRFHKSEKGVRGPGSLGPWHPARVTFRAPMAGQMGLHTRIVYNNKILDAGKGENKFKNLKNYGNVNSEYVVVGGSIQGPTKRQLLLTHALRETKKQKKKEYEFIELR